MMPEKTSATKGKARPKTVLTVMALFVAISSTFSRSTVATPLTTTSKPVGPTRSEGACDMPLGMENGDITAEQLQTLSMENQENGPSQARLNGLHGYRAVRSDVINQKFVRVIFDKETIVTGVATQGHGDPTVEEWVTKYYVKYDGSNSDRIQVLILNSEGKPKLFQGNNDSDTIVRHNFNPENVQSIYIMPQEAHNNVAFRFELYGCVMKKYVILWLSLVGEHCTLEMLTDRKSDGFVTVEKQLENETKEIAEFTGVQLVKIEHLRPGSLIVEIRVGVAESQVSQMILEAKDKLLGSTSRFDHNYFVVQDPEGTELCQPPVILFSNLSRDTKSPVTIQRSDSYTVTASVICRGLTRAKVTWKVARLHLNGTFESGRVVHQEFLDHTKENQTSWQIYGHSLEYGDYYVEVEAKMENSPKCVNYSYGFLKITESPIKAELVANPAQPQLFLDYHKELILNASGSYDPDVPPGEENRLKFTWICARKDEVLPNNTALLPVVTPPGNATTTTGNDTGCYGSGPGKLNFTGSEAKILLDHMAANTAYVIKLVVTKGTRRDEVSYEFTLSKMKLFHLTIRCHKNCREKVNPKQKMVFKGTCSGDACGQDQMQFRWSLYNETDGREANLPNSARLDLLEIKEGVLMEGQKYRIQLRGYLTADIKRTETDTFVTNESPSGGDCVVNRKTGTVLETNFTFNCFGWKDKDVDLTFQFGCTSSSGAHEILQWSTKRTFHTNKLPLGDPDKDNVVSLDIYIRDKWGGYGYKRVQVKVLPGKQINASTLYHYTVGNKSEIAKMMKRKDGGKKAMQLANTLLSVMSASSEEDLKKKDKIKLKDEMIRHTSKVQVNDLQALILVTSVVAGATEKGEELSEESQRNSVDVLQNMANKFKNISEQGKSSKDPSGIKKAGNNLLLGIGNVLDASAMSVKEAEQEPSERQGSEDKKANITQNKKLAQKAWNIINKVGDSLLSSREVGDEPVELETKAISMVLNRQQPDTIGDKPAKIGDSDVKFPPPDELFGPDVMGMSYVDTQMLSLKENPFTWDKSASSVKSPVISIDLKNERGQLLNVSGLSKEMELNIKSNRPPGDEPPLSTFAKPSINGSMQFHRMMISSEEMVINVKIVPQNGTTLQIYVRHRLTPTLENYDYVTEVPDFSSCERRSGNNGIDTHVNCTDDPYLVSLSSGLTGFLGLHFVGIRLPTSDDDLEVKKRRRRDCSGSGRQKREICVEFKDPPTTPPPTPRLIKPQYDPISDANYSISTSMGTCLYWSESEEKWTSEGCRLGPKSGHGVIQCLCTHLSAFGGDFLVAPNPIDFDKVWDSFGNLWESKNFVVLATVCGMFGLYAIAVVFSRRADRSDKRKVTQVIPLGEVNTKGHCYELTVYTGMWRRCGTSANVAVMIYGEDRETDAVALTYNTMCNKKLFARGSVNTFMLSLKESLGDLSHIKLWHDNTGDNPQWFVNKVVIRDPKTNNTWFFVCNRWLAAERDDGKIERVLYVSTPAEINSFMNKFYSRASTGLGDGHIWLSVVTRPPTSPFTRVQRVSCCLSVLMSAMVTNAMFYQFGAENTTDSFQIGPFILSWRQIIIGIQSAIIVVPINVLIVFIFRNIRPKDEVAQAYDTNSENPSSSDTPRSGGRLPRFFVYVGWALCFLTSLTSATFTVFYSMMWGTEVSNQWLTSILVSFTQDVLFIQPIKVIIVASLLSLIIKKTPEDESVKQQQKPVAYSKVQGESRELLLPDQQQLEKFREYRLRVLIMAQVIIELVFYLTFVWALMVICYGSRDTRHFRMTNGIDELLPHFQKVRNTPAFWKWTEKTLVSAMYNITWYNGQPFEYKEGFVSHKSGYLVGMPRLRQLRVKPGPCQIEPRYPDFTESLARPCLPPYSFNNEDQTLYNLPKWRYIPENQTAILSEFALHRMCPRPWRYHRSEDLHNLPFQGVRAVYGGGGFVADLGYTRGSAQRVINNLKNNSWIDERTRAVFIEFMIFDPSSNLFSAATYLFEVLPMGGASTFRRINTMALYGAREKGVRSFNAVCELVVIVVVCYFIVNETVKVYRQRCLYLKSAWAWVEILQILCAIATIVLSIFRRYHTTKLVNEIRENPFKTSSFHYAVLWSDLNTALMAILVFIITIKVLKILKFNEHICSLFSSMGRCRDKIISYSAVFLVAFLAFTQIALLVFGSSTQAYSSVPEVFRTQFAMFIGGSTNYDELKNANRIIGPIYFFLFMTAMACILINMFLAILNESYRESKLHPDDGNEEIRMLAVFLDHAKKSMGEKLTSLKNTKFFPKSNTYAVKHNFDQIAAEVEGKYRQLDWRNSDLPLRNAVEDTESDIERSLFKDIRRRLKVISGELKEMSLVPRRQKYDVQRQFEIQSAENAEDFKTPCKGLDLEKISSMCSLFSLSESNLYSNRQRRRESLRRLLRGEETSDGEDTEWGDGTSYTESLSSFFGNTRRMSDTDREPWSYLQDSYDKESLV